jgi:hypothetical protein
MVVFPPELLGSGRLGIGLVRSRWKRRRRGRSGVRMRRRRKEGNR